MVFCVEVKKITFSGLDVICFHDGWMPVARPSCLSPALALRTGKPGSRPVIFSFATMERTCTS